MNFRTFTVSDAFDTIADAVQHIHDGHPLSLRIAAQTLRTLGSLTEEYPPEYFTDDEIDYIAEATIFCLDNLLHTQGETE